MRSFVQLLEYAQMKAETSSDPHRCFWSATAADLADKVNYEGEGNTAEET